MNNIETLRKVASSLAKVAEENEKIFLPTLSSKLARANKMYPEDQTIGVMSTIVNKMSSSKLQITRAELKDMYQRLYSRNTKFAQLFSEELGSEEVQEEAPRQPVNHEPLNLDSVRESMIDPVLASALSQAFGGSAKPFHEGSAKLALSAVEKEFSFNGLYPRCSVATGKENLFICSASFATPRGESTVLVPVVLENGKAISPDTFVANGGTAPINKDSIVSYLRKEAGNRLDVRAEEVLGLLTKNAHAEISGVDLAFLKMSQASENESYVPDNLISGQTLDSINPNLVLNLPKIEDPEIESIAKKMESPLGAASFQFGSRIVQNGRAGIENSLRGWGVKNASTAVTDSDENSITYTVSVNGGQNGFKVPVTIANKIAQLPEILICAGSIKEFSRESIIEILSANSYDKKAVAAASPLYGNKPSELVQFIREATQSGKFEQAEDALNILASGDDKKAYASGFAAFSRGLSGEKSSDPVQKCAMIIRTSNSINPVCGHTGLTLDRVFQDKHGSCQPLHRRATLDSSDGGATFNPRDFIKG